MKPYETVIAAVDASERAAHVLRVASNLGARLGIPLQPLRAASIPREVPQSMLRLSPDEVEAKLTANAQEALDKLIADLKLEAKGRVEEGIPWDVICRAAEKESNPLIAIGSHGYQLVDRFLGTTAARVVNHAKSSVLIVRPEPDLEYGVRRVVVGLDESPRSAAVLAQALDVATKFARDKGEKVELTAVRIVQIPEHPERVLDPTMTISEGLVAHARDDLEKMTEAAAEQVKLDLVLTRGRPWKVLVETAEQRKADLVVIGTHGYDAVDHLIGTTAARVADRAHSSVLVVRNNE